MQLPASSSSVDASLVCQNREELAKSHRREQRTRTRMRSGSLMPVVAAMTINATAAGVEGHPLGLRM